MKKHRLEILLTAVLMLALLSGPQLGGRIALASGTAKFVAAPDTATIPRAFSYQGTLRLADGSLATGSYNITLRIYTTVIAGAALHTETFTNTVVRNGSFSVVVGDVTPIGATVFDNANLYLGITVEPDAEMLPRQRLFPVPWSMQAGIATTLTPNATVNGIVVNGITSINGATVISGATTISNQLTINRGTAGIGNGQWPGLLLSSNGDGYGSALYMRNTNGNWNWTIHPAASGELRFEERNSGKTALRLLQDGTVNVPGAFTVDSYAFVNDFYSSHNVLAYGKVYALQGFNGFCRGSGPIDVRCDQDVAETFGTDQRTEPGDLVVFIPEDRSFPAVKLSSKPYQGAIVGVVSTSPGLVFDQGHTTLAGDSSNLITDKKTVVAMVGRVPTKFSLENGPIAIGDPLTSGSTPGTAMKATEAGQIIGYAMQSSDAAEAVTSGKLLVWLQLGTYIPPQALAALNETASTGASITELKAQVAALAAQVAKLQAGN